MKTTHSTGGNITNNITISKTDNNNKKTELNKNITQGIKDIVDIGNSKNQPKPLIYNCQGCFNSSSNDIGTIKERKAKLDIVKIGVKQGNSLSLDVFTELNKAKKDKKLGLENALAIKDILKQNPKTIKLTVQEKFYNETSDLTKKVRDKKGGSLNELNKKLNDSKLLDYVRTKASKQDGAKRGNGEDEVFQTSKTSEWIKRSAGLCEGKYPTSFRKDLSGKIVEFNWMDMQQTVRHPTQFQLYKSTGGGHTGALFDQKSSPGKAKGHMTNGQIESHEKRNEEIMKSSTPRNGAIRGLRADLRLTPNSQEFDQVITKGFDYKDRDLSSDTERSQFKREYLIIQRNRIKDDIRYLREYTFNDDGASEVSDDDLSSNYE